MKDSYGPRQATTKVVAGGSPQPLRAADLGRCVAPSIRDCYLSRGKEEEEPPEHKERKPAAAIFPARTLPFSGGREPSHGMKST